MTERNAGGLHRVTKVVTLPPKQSKGNAGRGSPLAVVESRVRDWEQVWRCHATVDGPWRTDTSGEIEPLRAEDIAATQQAFKERTATAVEAMRRR